MSLVQLSHVTRTFASGTRALEDFNLAVAKGETATLIGPSGCGKSTALRLFAGLDDPSTGHVDWTGPRPAIGYVLQEPTLMPWATAFDNVWLPLRLQGTSRSAAQGRVRDALDLVGLGEFSGARPNELSGGMKMRVSIARALVTEPELLLLDEPFAALDEITRFRLNDELLALKQRLGLTIVFVTHSIFEAVYLSTRVLVMTPRPGHIAREFAIPARPRGEVFRTSVEYAELARDIAAALRACGA